MKTFDGVLITLLVIAMMLLGMFWSFKGGGFMVARDCEMGNHFYHGGKVYLCFERKLTEKQKSQPAPRKPMTF